MPFSHFALKALGQLACLCNHILKGVRKILYVAWKCDIENIAIMTAVMPNPVKAMIFCQKKERRGRKFNRKLSGFPYFKFTEYLTYKAALAGIKVIKILEDWTSQTCRKCKQRGTRRTQGLFMCKTCGEENADRNAAFNIAYRALGYISKVGVTVNIPITLASTV